MDSRGLAFISAVLHHDKPDALLWLQEEDFSEDSLEVYTFVREHYQNYGELPKIGQIENTFQIDMPYEDGNLEWFRDTLKERTRLKRLHDVSQRLRDHLKMHDAAAARSALLNYLMDDVDTREMVQDFATSRASLDMYDAQKRGLISYMETPWPTLTKQIKGWERGTVNVMAALTSTGKTWIACSIADFSYTQGYNVLFVSMEMPKFKVQRRLSCIHYKLPFDDIVLAELTYDLEDDWINGFEREKDRENKLWIADQKTVTSVADIVLLVHTLKPDLLVIDSAYRLESEGRGAWEQAKDTVQRCFKGADETRIPWVATTQLGAAGERGTDNKKSANLYNIRYAREWATDPDVVVMLTSNADLLLLKQVEMEVKKFREIGDVNLAPFRVYLDKQTPRFGEVPLPDVDEEVEIDWE